MSIDVPVIGERILAEQGIAIITQLNRQIQLTKSADQSSNSTTAADISGLTFPVVNGKSYGGSIRIRYSCSATNQGCQVGILCPTGNVLVMVTTYGIGAPNTATVSRLAASGDITSVATVDTLGSGRAIEISLDSYDCTADGTFAFQFRRGGTTGSTGATIHKGANGLILVSG